ncbi:ACT domain-containing protein [Arenimonas composti]|uniref:Uncharacterized protein n=1 Tax=Arenimonas composti TR7-09 = DSM 18010 TaxID=1121013 RepID=A0A091BE29_9GAMM|nr:ACT domain-containing protein [Arenimonas composti]KFN49797.1 hypothetical protein P873_09585 [Arenimonas composti TR7-09 = DSM 18010]
MPPISDLATLLASLRPELRPGRYAFVALPAGATLDLADAVATMREAEGLTVVVAADVARARGWPLSFSAEWITLAVDSDLAAVGLTAAFATALADAGIACNVIAGVHHDHLFVPAGRGDEALVALRELQRSSSVVADGPRPGALS